MDRDKLAELNDLRGGCEKLMEWAKLREAEYTRLAAGMRQQTRVMANILARLSDLQDYISDRDAGEWWKNGPSEDGDTIGRPLDDAGG
ncbi:MAG: hypothetical protein SFU86_07565 [Pirellulaceae bacterium]|nr:hypothetical protein [Pirellulaceae bacterium]